MLDDQSEKFSEADQERRDRLCLNAKHICGHYLYFTSFCTIEAMHVHAGDEQLSEPKSAKFFVRADGSSVLKRRGDLTKIQQAGIQAYIKKNYLAMYTLWSTMSDNGFYVGAK